MNNYNIVVNTEKEKYRIIDIIRNAGAVLTGVSGYGSGFYIQLSANDIQVNEINNKIAEV